MTPPELNPAPRDFIRQIIDADRVAGKHGGRVHTRFPPEPNGYLHIGHAKSICVNFGIAEEYGGKCNLRFDDTNPTKEDTEYVDAIQRDVRWLGFDWQDRLFFASDYFERLHDWAVELIRIGKAYVDHLTAEQIRDYRGTLTEPGRDSPHRNRSVAENLDWFAKMRAGSVADGECVLRAKIDMRSPNINLRDPTLYRVRKVAHHRTGDRWFIYPLYDFTHGLSDALEGITHSLCTLEFENNRPLYDWFLETLNIAHRPQQIEFSRLNLTHTVVTKRKLRELVSGGMVRGWDDPRLPTLAGMRRRGYTPEAIRAFVAKVGVTKFEGTTELAVLENSLREDLNRRAPRVMAVLRPLRVVIENWPAGHVELLDAVNNPEDPTQGTRSVPFGRELWIERDDFREDPPKQFHRLSVGKEVRLRWAYFLKCTAVVKDPGTGEVVALRCTYDPATKGGNAPDGRKVKGTIHWVSVEQALEAEVRLYDHLFSQPDPDAEGNYLDCLNPHSLEVVAQAKVEPSLRGAVVGAKYQFERLGYFCVDPDSKGTRPVFNRAVTLKDTWAKIEKKSEG